MNFKKILPKKKREPTVGEIVEAVLEGEDGDGYIYGYNQAIDDCHQALEKKLSKSKAILNWSDIGNIINEFTYNHRKGKEGLFAISHNEGMELGKKIHQECLLRLTANLENNND